MRLLIIRHGDPDYAIDGLTEKGKREVALLADRLGREEISAIYCSPLGRAQLTAAPFAERLGLPVVTADWLREFDHYENGKIMAPDLTKPDCCWDRMPALVEQYPDLYHPTRWREVDFIQNSRVPELYDMVCRSLDDLLAKYGYVRKGCGYRVVRSNHDTVALVCHFGLGSVLLSRLMNASPYVLWQHTVMLPTSVTTFHSEERQEGIAHFRAAGIGDVSHLYAGNEPPAFAARFCECFTDDTTH